MKILKNSKSKVQEATQARHVLFVTVNKQRPYKKHHL